jgi:glycosyltransferase involved in cell wall biosynthesis
MRTNPVIDVLIPAWNEEDALPLVLEALPSDWVRQVIVCDNGSTDRTAVVAEQMGAVVVTELERGYGAACLAGMRYLQLLPKEEQPDVLVFMDGDYSDYPEELPALVAPILEGSADMVIGSRLAGGLDKGVMTVPQQFGNWLAPTLIKWMFGYSFTDLGPFRAIRWDSLLALEMKDRNFGWTVEMQVKAARKGLRCTEMPVQYRKRAAGESKVSGTVKGTIKAGWKILYTIFREKCRSIWE